MPSLGLGNLGAAASIGLRRLALAVLDVHAMVETLSAARPGVLGAPRPSQAALEAVGKVGVGGIEVESVAEPRAALPDVADGLLAHVVAAKEVIRKGSAYK